MAFPKIVENAHYHLWSDALHARELAKQAKNRWDRGTYVRWAVTTVWTVLEMACEDALETTGIGRRFRENLDAALAAKNLKPPDWGAGLWQRVAILHGKRTDWVHINWDQDALFPESADADNAVAVVREAVADLYKRARKQVPGWLRDDEDRGWDRGQRSLGHISALRGRVDPQGPDTVRIAYEYKDREYISAYEPPGTDYLPLIDDLLVRIRLPISAVRAYHGSRKVYERLLTMRGA